jgi:hypothetical protein
MKPVITILRGCSVGEKFQYSIFLRFNPWAFSFHMQRLPVGFLPHLRLCASFHSSPVAVPLLITLLVNRYYGRVLAIYAFLIIAFSHWYFYWNIQIIHYSISNLSLFTSFFILFYFRPRVFLFFLAGFTMGWAMNARLSLGPTGAVLFILIMTHIGQVQEVSWKERFLKRGLPFVFGGVLASLPTLAILIADSEAFLFNLLQARMKFRDDIITTILNPENLDFFQSFLKRRLAVIYQFFFWANSSRKSMIQNSFLLVVTSMIALIFFKRSKEERKTWRREIFQDTFISSLFWLGLVIFLSHFFTVMPTGYYVQYLFPIMTIILLGILFHGGIHSITPLIKGL